MALQAPSDVLFGTSAARLWAAGCRPTAGRAMHLIPKTVQLTGLAVQVPQGTPEE